MKGYTERTLSKMPDGWYWLSRFDGDVPRLVQCHWRDLLPNFPRHLYVDRGYGPGNYTLVPGDHDDHRRFRFVGPLPMPTNAEMRGFAE